MIGAGARSFPVKIYSAPTGVDEYGEPNQNGEYIATAFVARMNRGSREYSAIQAIHNDINAVFVSRLSTAISDDQRLVDQMGREWAILGVEHDFDKRETVIMARSVT